MNERHEIWFENMIRKWPDRTVALLAEKRYSQFKLSAKVGIKVLSENNRDKDQYGTYKTTLPSFSPSLTGYYSAVPQKNEPYFLLHIFNLKAKKHT